MFSKVLVANRGEIAVRVMRTLRSLGIASVAVYSDADTEALHVLVADEAVMIGPAEPRLSYLSIDKVIDAALRTGADAVHPGYGFLSENAEFAEACERAGIVFIGPDSGSIRLMGDKRGAKDSVAALGVPVVPGFHGEGADDEQLVQECAALGFPVIVKPSAGGGGKGMRVVNDASEVASALSSSRREAMSAFGDDTLLLEKFLPRARHVEVQVLGDGRGGVVHLGDRDCSLQRRHQKVIEEAPAPFLADEVRSRMHDDAVAIARSVSYRGLGTVEFVVDADDTATYFFLEMNTRLQVEHPVTEIVSGLDLVELQLRIAAGHPMPMTQGEVQIVGHAVEARVYAEDGHHGFLPSSGRLAVLGLPANVRVDSGVQVGTLVGTSYDPLLFKVVAGGTHREAALDALDVALAGTSVLGLAHNIGALRELLAAKDVRAGTMTTSLVGGLGLGSTPATPDVDRTIAAALTLCARRELRAGASAWTQMPGWRVGQQAPVVTVLVDEDGRQSTVSVYGPSDDCQVSVDGGPLVAASLRLGPPGASSDITVSVDGVGRRYSAALDDRGPVLSVWIGAGGDSWSYREPVRDRIRRPDDPDEDEAGDLRSPMPGIVAVLAKAEGDLVLEGELIAVVEAMKMEYPLVSPLNGTLVSLPIVLGAQVERDQVVAVVHPDPGS